MPAKEADLKRLLVEHFGEAATQTPLGEALGFKQEKESVPERPGAIVDEE